MASLASQAGFCSKGCLLLFTGNLEVQAATQKPDGFLSPETARLVSVLAENECSGAVQWQRERRGQVQDSGG